jgi:hypothetical protein
MSSVTFDPTLKLIIPDGPIVGGIIQVDFRTEVYLAGKADWRTDPTLNERKFPIRVEIASTAIATATFVLEEGWQMRHFEGDYTLQVTGIVRTDDNRAIILPSVGTFSNSVEWFVPDHVVTDLTLQGNVQDLHWATMNRKFTDPVTGKYKVYDPNDALWKQADAWADDGTTPYDGGDLERVDRLVDP